MEVKFVEAGGQGNWGKFGVARFTTEELARPSALPGEPYRASLVLSQGWGPQHVFVFDLATGEGAFFPLGGVAGYDLQKHRIWVCVLFEAFLDWLHRFYRDKGGDWWEDLPECVDLPDVPFSLSGFRRPGHTETYLRFVDLVIPWLRNPETAQVGTLWETLCHAGLVRDGKEELRGTQIDLFTALANMATLHEKLVAGGTTEIEVDGHRYQVTRKE